MHEKKHMMGLGFGLVESRDPLALDNILEDQKRREEERKPMGALLDRLDTRAVSEEFTRENRLMDGSGKFRVVDRDTAQLLKSGLPSRAHAVRWAKRNMLVPMSEEDQIRVERTDPVATAILREHPDTVLVGRF